jgi:hypothetical protein
MVQCLVGSGKIKAPNRWAPQFFQIADYALKSAIQMIGRMCLAINVNVGKDVLGSAKLKELYSGKLDAYFSTTVSAHARKPDGPVVVRSSRVGGKIRNTP